ncbi:MAG: DNA polymerase IV [Firmicutes bacterium]|nr:DNA polymerase IV [Bacillota bacterium]
MDRTILHCDCNGFYASVECVLNPELKNVPMAVGGSSENRHGIILAKNELAKKYNIQTAETIHQARQKCPNLVIVPPRHDIYKQFSQRVMDIYKRYTDLIEPFGLDEAWLDVTGSARLFGDGVTIANNLRKIVREEIGLTISVGVSFCKVFAKLGSDYKKPDATTVFSRENWRKYIFQLNASELLYVGKNTKVRLDELGLKTIGDLARADERLLTSRLGKAGTQLHLYANGLDREPVRSIYEKTEVKSVGKGETFPRDLLGEDVIRHSIKPLCDSVAQRLRKHGLKCSTVQVQLRDPSFRTIQRQRKLPRPTSVSRDIHLTAMEIITDCWNMQKPLRMITVTGTGLIKEDAVHEQISLFDTPDERRKKQETIERTVDAIKNKFGKSAIGIINKKENENENKK